MALTVNAEFLIFLLFQYSDLGCEVNDLFKQSIQLEFLHNFLFAQYEHQLFKLTAFNAALNE